MPNKALCETTLKASHSALSLVLWIYFLENAFFLFFHM